MEWSVAEREGFEPSIRFWRILTFQASAFDHSATAPHVLEGVRTSRAAAVPQGRLGAFGRRDLKGGKTGKALPAQPLQEPGGHPSAPIIR